MGLYRANIEISMSRLGPESSAEESADAYTGHAYSRPRNADIASMPVLTIGSSNLAAADDYSAATSHFI